MSDLISRDFIQKCRGVVLTQEVIDAMPTVDAVEVVRCGGCKYSKLYTYSGVEELFCECDDFMRNPNDFCSHGERKEETE